MLPVNEIGGPGIAEALEQRRTAPSRRWRCRAPGARPHRSARRTDPRSPSRVIAAAVASSWGNGLKQRTASVRIPGGSVLVQQSDLTTLHQQLTAVMELTQGAGEGFGTGTKLTGQVFFGGNGEAHGPGCTGWLGG